MKAQVIGGKGAISARLHFHDVICNKRRLRVVVRQPALNVFAVVLSCARVTVSRSTLLAVTLTISSVPSAFKSVALNQSPTARAGKSAPLPGVRLILVLELVMPLAKREIALFDNFRPMIPPDRQRHDSTLA